MMPSRPKRGRIPGDAGVGVGPVRRRRDQHVEVGHRRGTGSRSSTLLEVSTAADAAGRRPALAIAGGQTLEEGRVDCGSRPRLDDGDEDRVLARREQASAHRWRRSPSATSAPARSSAPSRARRRRARGRTGATPPAPRTLRPALAAALAADAAHLEDVGEVAGEGQRQRQLISVARRGWRARCARAASRRTDRSCARCGRCP